MIKLSVVIGRFQPVHKQHLKQLILPAMEDGDATLILLGSENRSTDTKNPFSVKERALMIEMCVDDHYEKAGATYEHLFIRGVRDFVYSEDLWVQEVRLKVAEAAAALSYMGNDKVEVCLFGVTKDASSYYLKHFSDWGYSGREVEFNIGSTSIRNSMFRRHDQTWAKHVPGPAANWIRDHYMLRPDFADMCAELKGTERYVESTRRPPLLSEVVGQLRYSATPESKVRRVIEDLHDRPYYPPVYVTVDSIVTHMGRVLLIKRKKSPGKGLWALPGGFIDVSELMITSALRELKEETGLELSADRLVSFRLFDDPHRSLRGRVITQAYHFALSESYDHHRAALAVRGGDDAAKAVWVNIEDALDNDEYYNRMFEDHSCILSEMLHEHINPLSPIFY